MVRMANTDGKCRARTPQQPARRSEDDLEQPFDPGTALEQLRTAVVRLQALSNAAVSSFEFLPQVKEPAGRRALEHTCSLVAVLDEEIANATAIGDKMVEQLGEFLKKQRS